MSERIELLMKTYPDKRLELKVMEIQFRNFAGISENEVIDSMMFTQPEGERVQTSGVSDKTASIALSYREKRDRINREWYEYLFHRYEELKEELEFFEKAIGQLSGNLSSFVFDLVIEGMTWEALASKYSINRRTVGKYRKKAIVELEKIYKDCESCMADYMLE